MRVAPKVEAADEFDLAVNRLLDHLVSWLRVQPEWVYFIGVAPRDRRRRVAQLVAKELTEIPAAESTGLSRSLRRSMAKRLRGDTSGL
jgi:hypothetical protein